MSGDYDYDNYGEYDDNYYDDNNQMQEEDGETLVELAFYEAEEALRNNDLGKALKQIEQIYQQAQKGNLKDWKVKLLNTLLQVYCRENNRDKIFNTLQRIKKLNNEYQYTKNAIKTIIIAINSLQGELYKKVIGTIKQFIDQLDTDGKAKSYLMLLDKAMEHNEKKLVKEYMGIIEELAQNTISAGLMLEFYSLQIKDARIRGDNSIRDRIRKMQINLPYLEKEAYMSEGHLSVLKEAIAGILFAEGDYDTCAQYLNEAFQEYSKTSKGDKLENILLCNVLVCLLFCDQEQIKNNKFNALFQESATPLKLEPRIESLMGLMDFYYAVDIQRFKTCFRQLNFKPQEDYKEIFNKLLMKIQKMKLRSILVNYRRVTFDYLMDKINQKDEKILRQLLYELIVSGEIRGRIQDGQGKVKHLQLYQPKNQFLSGQLENIKELLRGK